MAYLKFPSDLPEANELIAENPLCQAICRWWQSDDYDQRPHMASHGDVAVIQKV